MTVRGRIENVTDLDAFPELFRGALAAEPHLSVVHFDPPAWPHTTTVVIRIAASRQEDAQRAANEVMLPIFRSVAETILGDKPFGWVLSVDAVPVVVSRASRSVPTRVVSRTLMIGGLLAVIPAFFLPGTYPLHPRLDPRPWYDVGGDWLGIGLVLVALGVVLSAVARHRVSRRTS